MNLPNLLIVGAAKSGTTSLHNYLDQHPNIFMSDFKEPHFLINDIIGSKRIHNGVLSLKEYEKLFLNTNNYTYRGESSVMYLLFAQEAIENIKKYLGENVKIIIMLRNPIERAYSGYQHVKRYNHMENLSFEDAIGVCEKRYMEVINFTPASRYLEIGNYYNQVKLFMDNFSNVHVMIYDDYKYDINAEINKVLRFLDLPEHVIDTRDKHMVGGWEWKNIYLKKLILHGNIIKKIFSVLIPSNYLRVKIRLFLQNLAVRKTENMRQETKNKLVNYYRDDVLRLSALLDKDLTFWLD